MRMASLRHSTLPLLLAAGILSAFPAFGQLAYYNFNNDLQSTDSASNSTASDLVVGNPGYIYYVTSSVSNICLDGTWSTTAEQGPFNNSSNYFEIEIAPNSGFGMDLDSIKIRTWGSGTSYAVRRIGVYADEDPGPGGDNFATKIGGLTSIFPEDTYTIPLDGVSWLQSAIGPVKLRIYFWASTVNSNHAEINWIKVYGSTYAIPVATIGNKVWLDSNCDGIRTYGEPGISGVAVRLYHESDPSTPVQATTTSSNGGYSFTVLPGTYIVEVVPPPGHVWTAQYAGSSHSDSNGSPLTNRSDFVTVASGQTDNTIDFGFCLCTGAGALALDLGPACNLPLDPVLTATPPVVGQTSTICLTGDPGFANALGFWFASFPPVTPWHEPVTGCNVYVDIFNLPNLYLINIFFTDGNGDWCTEIPVPSIAELAGLELIFQIRLCAPNGPQGPLDPDWLSNGLRYRVGCF